MIYIQCIFYTNKNTDLCQEITDLYNICDFQSYFFGKLQYRIIKNKGA